MYLTSGAEKSSEISTVAFGLRARADES